jgi:ABC-type amino acid transport substrate-binding protein/CheY-like chemotaxis protein
MLVGRPLVRIGLVLGVLGVLGVLRGWLGLFRCLAWLSLLGLGLGLSVASAAPVSPSASAAAQAAPAKRPLLRYGVLANFPPLQVWPAGSRAGGADVEILYALARDAGLVLEPVRYTDFAALEADLAAGRIAVASSMARNAAREGQFLFLPAYIQLPLGLVTRTDQPSAALLPDLAGRSIAVVKGYASSEQVDRLFPLASRVVVGTLQEGLEAVRSGRADTLLESLPVLADLIERQQIKGLSIVRRVEAPSGRLHLALHASQRAAADALAQAQGRFPAGRAESLVQAWSVKSMDAPPTSLALSDADRATLAQWPAPVVGIVGRDPSFAAPGADGRPEGLTVDLLKAVLKRLGVTPRDWIFLAPADLQQALVQGRVDVVLGADEDADRTPLLRFIGPFIEYPTVLIGAADSGAFDLDQLNGRRLALTPNSPARPLVDSRHPSIRVVDCADVDACIDAVAARRADATLADVVTAALAMARRPRPELQMIGSEPRLRRFHSVALAERHAALVPLVKRSLDVAQQIDLPPLKAQWLSRPTRQDLLQSLAWRYGPWLAALLLAISALWLWHSRGLQAEIRRTLRARAAAERAAASTRRFTAFLAHEVRNSLHAVVAGTELARLPGPARGDVGAMLAESARNTLHLLNNLIDRERLDTHGLALRLAPAALGPLVLAVVDELRPAATVRGVAVQARLPDVDPPLMLDALRLQQVLRNLLANAIKYGGDAAIDVAAWLQPMEDGRWAVSLEVLDRGQGLPEPASDAQDPAAAYGPTAGLGLPLCQDLAQLMGGSLDLAPRAGGGLQARLQFSATAAPLDPLQPLDSPRPPAAQRPAVQAPAWCVLVVEDAEVYALLLARALELSGHQVLSAGSVHAAREALLQHRVDLLLTDVHLPDGDAAQLLQQLPPAALPPRVVVMTADLDSAPATAHPALTGWPLLQKTEDVRAFVDAVLRAASPLLPAPA